MENKKKIAPIMMVAMVMVAAFSIIPVSAPGNPGSGCESETKYYGNLTGGGVYFEQQGWYQNTPMTRTFNNVPDGIKFAKVYTGIWGGTPAKGGEFNITVNGNTTATYKACDPCPQPDLCGPWQHLRCDALNASINWDVNQHLDTTIIRDYVTGCNVHFMSYNATPYITPGTNTIAVNAACRDPNDCYGVCWYNQAYLIALLVVYENSSMANMTYWINEGAPYLVKGSKCVYDGNNLSASLYLDGLHIDNVKKVKYRTLGWPHVINATEGAAYTKLNGNDIGVPDVTECGDTNCYSENLLRWTNIPTEYINDTLYGGSNKVEYYDDDPNYERTYVAVLTARGPVPNPDLIVTDMKFPRTGMRPGLSETQKIDVTVKNDGGVATAGTFNVSLSAGGYNDKKTIGPLVPEGRETVTFTVNPALTANCYDFTVVADCDNDVDEVAYEYNNEETEKRQVGYVIVVGSNSDFEHLNASNVNAASPLPAGCFENKSGTYYIQNMKNEYSVENCAGPGIDIRNTDAHFVITNCTVHNCGGGNNGVHLHSVKYGKVNGSCVMANNTGKGIRMQNCSYIDIENSSFLNNSIYGIEVYPTVMPKPSCKYINITNNNCSYNEYGIELIGDNCIVRDNIISNNWRYGMYGYGNDSQIYNNTIRDNDDYGIMMNYDIPSQVCLRNCIFGNTFIDNNRVYNQNASQAYDSGDNYWNTTTPLGYYNDTCAGADPACAHDNYIGNNWSDYNGTDEGDDKIGDAWYPINDSTPVQHPPSANDTGPLMDSWVNYARILCGDVDCSGGVTTDDVHPVFRRVYGDPVCSDWAADVDCSGGVTTDDVHPTFRRVYGDPVNCCEGCA